MTQSRESFGRPIVEDRFGHHWTEPDRVDAYVAANDDAQTDERAEGYQVLLAVIPFNQDAKFRILDIGSGTGTLAGIILEAFPNAEAVGFELSEPMMNYGRKRMAQFGNRFSYHVGDFADGELPADLPGPFDVAVAARAIHHLPGATKAKLYRAIYANLNPGGAFFNVDQVGADDDFLKGLYRQANAYLKGERPDRTVMPAPRPPSASHFWDPLSEHMAFLRAAGFVSPDCFWKRNTNTVIGGFKRA
jgi:SAM-dependent methyltransferase